MPTLQGRQGDLVSEGGLNVDPNGVKSTFAKKKTAGASPCHTVYKCFIRRGDPVWSPENPANSDGQFVNRPYNSALHITHCELKPGRGGYYPPVHNCLRNHLIRRHATPSPRGEGKGANDIISKNIVEKKLYVTASP